MQGNVICILTVAASEQVPNNSAVTIITVASHVCGLMTVWNDGGCGDHTY